MLYCTMVFNVCRAFCGARDLQNQDKWKQVKAVVFSSADHAKRISGDPH